jgi:hypothetical protein
MDVIYIYRGRFSDFKEWLQMDDCWGYCGNRASCLMLRVVDLVVWRCCCWWWCGWCGCGVAGVVAGVDGVVVAVVVVGEGGGVGFVVVFAAVFVVVRCF